MRKPRLLEQLCAANRFRHYSVRTEHAYVDRVCRYIVFHGKRHPGVMGAAEISKFLSHLATDLNVAAGTQGQRRQRVMSVVEVLTKGFSRLRSRIEDVCAGCSVQPRGATA